MPGKADWQKFLSSYPTPGAWICEPAAELTRDGLALHDSWGDCYLDMRKHLPDEMLVEQGRRAG